VPAYGAFLLVFFNFFLFAWTSGYALIFLSSSNDAIYFSSKDKTSFFIFNKIIMLIIILPK